MSSRIGPAQSSPLGRSHRTGALSDLESAISDAKNVRREQLSAVEEELERLSSIYERLHSDLATARRERDQALQEIQDERRKRARDMLQLAEKLKQAQRARRQARENASDEPRESFIKQRLSQSTPPRYRLEEGELPSIPGYDIFEPLGKGGMATVYAARRKEDGLDVALKLLHEGAHASKVRTELFLREAALLLQLDHVGLVRALDAGECGYGRFLVLELVEGESLAGHIRREGPLNEAEAVQLGIQVARVLAYCAKLGITHRDVKPSNLLRERDGRIKLCDFGLAALVEGDDEGKPYGSPGYASPEQIRTPGDVDERADIYGLGCTLWHLVVGRRAFPGKSKETFRIQRKQDVVDPRFEGADISARFAQIIRKMGRREREKRYKRWDECLLDLMLVETGSPPLAAHLSDAREIPEPIEVKVSDTVEAFPEDDPMHVELAAAERGARRAAGIVSETGSLLPADATTAPDTVVPAAGPGEDTRTVPAPTPVEPQEAASSAAPEADAAPPQAAEAPPTVEPSPSDAILPVPREPPRVPAFAWALAALVLVLAGWVAALAGRGPAGIDDLAARARVLATEGRRAEAVAGLRHAAALATDEDAARLRDLADELERTD